MNEKKSSMESFKLTHFVLATCVASLLIQLYSAGIITTPFPSQLQHYHRYLMSAKEQQQRLLLSPNSIPRTPPHHVTSTMVTDSGKQYHSGRLRILFGIFTADFRQDRTYRKRHRSLFKLWNDPRVCSIDDFKTRPVAERNECQLIYAFVLGANPDAPPHLLDESRPYEVQRPIKSSIQTDDINEPDTILLNIRENMEDGKSQTWFKYAAEIAKRYDLDYIAKCDGDSILHLHEFFMFAYINLPPAPYNQHIYAGALRDKAFFPRKKTEEERIRFESYFGNNFEGVHLYVAGQLYIISTDLAEFVGNEALASNCSYCEGIEDHDISAMAFHSPDPISLKVIGRSHRFWEHPVKGQPRWNRIWERESARVRGIPFEGKMLARSSTLDDTLQARKALSL